MPRRVTFARGEFPGPRSINSITTDYKNFIGVIESECMRIFAEAARMQLEATLPYVPVQYGGLKESGRAVAVHTPKGVIGRVSFGGEDAPVTPTPNAPTGIVGYAAIVNYRTDREGGYFMEYGAAESKDEVDHYIKSELKKIKPPKTRK